MRLTIFSIAVVGLLSPMFTDARPSKALRLLTGELNRRDTDCETLARSADKALNFFLQVIPLTPAGVRDYIERFLGINLLNPDEMRRVVCRLSEASTLSGLKEALDDLGITIYAITGAYNMGAASSSGFLDYVRRAIENGWIPEDEMVTYVALKDALGTLIDSHLVGFDPDGTRWMMEQTLGVSVSSSDWPANNTAENVDAEALCDNLMEGINILLDNAVFGSIYEDDIVSEVDSVTGVDLHDRETIRDIVCSITEATSIQDLANVVENVGIFDNAFAFLYDQGVSELLMMKEMYDYESDESQYYSYYQQQWQEYRDAREAVYLPVINGMAEIGLLTLENDLTD